MFKKYIAKLVAAEVAKQLPKPVDTLGFKVSYEDTMLYLVATVDIPPGGMIVFNYAGTRQCSIGNGGLTA